MGTSSRFYQRMDASRFGPITMSRPQVMDTAVALIAVEHYFLDNNGLTAENAGCIKGVDIYTSTASVLVNLMTTAKRHLIHCLDQEIRNARCVMAT